MARALAPDLGGWAAGLASLPYEWRAFLAPWAERIATAVGPLRTRDVLGGGAPRGFSGLARRGPYDRLLLTEWLLADELPEEFMRRAVMSEHTFLAVERSEPRGALSCAVLLDSGPDQLGAPRLAQLAALVALGRRAEAAGAEFRFGVLQDATTTLYATLDASAIRAILDARTIEIPADAHLEPWGWLLGSEPLPEDVWLLGGATMTTLARRHGLRALTLEEPLDPDARTLEVTVVERAHASPAVVLERPEAATEVRLLRDPNVAPAPPPRLRPRSLPHPRLGTAVRSRTELVFSPSGRRLFARLVDGRAVAFGVPNAVGRRRRKPFLYEPEGNPILAVGWHRGTALSLFEGADGQVVLTGARGRDPCAYRHTVLARGDEAARVLAGFDDQRLPLVARLAFEGVPTKTWVRDVRGQLWVHDGDAAALDQVGGGSVESAAWRPRPRAAGLAWPIQGAGTQGSASLAGETSIRSVEGRCSLEKGEPNPVSHFWVRPTSALFISERPLGLGRHLLDLTSGSVEWERLQGISEVVTLGPPTWHNAEAASVLLVGRDAGGLRVDSYLSTEPLRFDAGAAEVIGLVSAGVIDGSPGPKLVCRSGDDLGLLAPGGGTMILPTGGANLLTVAVSPEEPAVAWLCDAGRLCVYHVTQGFLVDERVELGS